MQLLETKAEIQAALKMADPLAAAAAVELACSLGQSSHRVGSPEELQQALVRATMVAAQHLDLKVESNDLAGFLSEHHRQILIMALSMRQWIEVNEARFQKVTKYAGRAALVSLGAAFGIWIG